MYCRDALVLLVRVFKFFFPSDLQILKGTKKPTKHIQSGQPRHVAKYKHGKVYQNDIVIIQLDADLKMLFVWGGGGGVEANNHYPYGLLMEFLPDYLTT